MRNSYAIARTTLNTSLDIMRYTFYLLFLYYVENDLGNLAAPPALLKLLHFQTESHYFSQRHLYKHKVPGAQTFVGSILSSGTPKRRL